MRKEDIVESIGYRGCNINIGYDTDAESPRTWDNLGTMICFHGKYCLGDKHDLCSRDFEDWDAVEQYLRKTHKPVILYELHLYDHSGLTISTSPFAYRWDSGQVGFILATRADILAAYRAKRLSKRIIKQAKQCILAEVRDYDSYIGGIVWRFEIVDETGEAIDECGSYFGDWKESGIIKDAEAAIDASIA